MPLNQPAPKPNLILPPISWTDYSEVKLNRSVTVRDHFYRPGTHVVDQATLTAMQSAGVVADVKPAG